MDAFFAFLTVVTIGIFALIAPVLVLVCASIGWKQRQRRLTTDPVIDMQRTARFSKEKRHCWQMQDAPQHGRPS